MNLGQHNSRAIKALQGSVEDAQAYIETIPEELRTRTGLPVKVQVKSTLRTVYKVKQRMGK